MNKLYYGDKVLIKKGFYKGLQGVAVEYQSNSGDLISKFGVEPVEEDQYGIKLDETGKVIWLDESYLLSKEGNKRPSKKRYLKTKTGRKYLPKSVG